MDPNLDLKAFAQIVVVEDSPDDARMTLRALATLDDPPTVRLAVDGSEVLLMLAATGTPLPTLILLDMKLPKVNGLEVLRRLKETESTAHIPVIIFTSSDEPRDIEAALGLGADAYICKPMDPKAYVKAVCSAAAKYLLTCVATF